MNIGDNPEEGRWVERLEHIQQVEPDPAVFQIPSDYEVKYNDPKPKQ